MTKEKAIEHHSQYRVHLTIEAGPNFSEEEDVVAFSAPYAKFLAVFVFMKWKEIND